MAYSDEQQMLTLSFLSYLGFYETSMGMQSSVRTRQIIERALQASNVLEHDWRLVWGPSMYRLPPTVFDENLMFVVQSLSNPSRYAIIIRGTNPVSITNWVAQDFNVVQQTSWPYYRGGDGRAPKISKGSARGLQALQSIKPRASAPGFGQTIDRFLAGEMQRNRSDHITLLVAGHSLGGALAPTLALWLADTQRVSDDPDMLPWDKDGKAHLEVFAFAGPSPGNADFAAYYDAKLGRTTHRTWNQYDVVPYGWVSKELAKLPKLYDPDIAPNLWMSLVLRSTTVLARHGNYQHVVATAQAAAGAKPCPLLADYRRQMIYQHTAAYAELLRLLQELDPADHFDFDDHMREVVHRWRMTALKDGSGNGSALRTIGELRALGTAAHAAQATRSIKRSATSKALHRAYRIPVTLLLTLIPEALALHKLRHRKDRFHTRLGRHHGPAQMNAKEGETHVDPH